MELNQVPLRQNLLDLTRPSDRGEPFDTDILKYWREKKLVSHLQCFLMNLMDGKGQIVMSRRMC